MLNQDSQLLTESHSGLKNKRLPEIKYSWKSFQDNKYFTEKIVSEYEVGFQNVYYGDRTVLYQKAVHKLEYLKFPFLIKKLILFVFRILLLGYNILFAPFRRAMFKMMLMDRILIGSIGQAYKSSIEDSKNSIEEYKTHVTSLRDQVRLLERELHYSKRPALSGEDYIKFESLYRGTQESIKRKMGVYVSYLETQKKWSSNNLILDVGCGRGEFLSVAKKRLGCQVLGIDSNPLLKDILGNNKVDFICEDVFSYLEKAVEKYDVISSFHLIEHLQKIRLPFFLQLCVQALKPGGHLILEWPNVTSLSVTGDTFELDPTHISKPHPLYVRTLLVWYGLEIVNELDLSPHEDFQKWTDLPKDSREYKLAYKIYGSQDKGLIAKRPN